MDGNNYIICKAKRLIGHITKYGSLGQSVGFVSLESQCFPRPELGTHIFVYFINRDKTSLATAARA